MRRFADYVYRGVGGARVRVFRVVHPDGLFVGWDVDYTTPDMGTVSYQGEVLPVIETYSEEAADYFSTKREALEWAQRRFGALRPHSADRWAT